MDSLTDTRPISRLEIVDTGRRRRWSDEAKVRIVEESLSGPRLASATARSARDFQPAFVYVAQGVSRGATWRARCHWTRMLRSLAKFSESEVSNHTPSLADFTTTTPELKFSVHIGWIDPELLGPHPRIGRRS